MTVAAIAPVVTYNENGSSKAFAVPFQFIAAADLIVERFDPAGARTLLVLGTDYTVTGGAMLGGTVTTTVAKPAGWQIKVSRATPRTQPANYTPHDTFPAEMHEGALDREMLCIQEIDYAQETDEDEFDALVARALRVPAPETINELPVVGGRAFKLLGFDGAGQPQPVDRSSLVGNPGGNIMSVGLFTALPGLSIPLGTDLIQTSGWATPGLGAALLIADPLVDAAFVAAHPKWSTISANGRGFRLLDVQTLWIEMFGAVGDATSANVGTDDDPAFIAAKDFQNYFRSSPSGNTDYKPVPTIWLRARGYRSAGGARTAFEFKLCAHDFRSVGSNFQGYGGAYIWVDAGNPGCVIQCWDSEGLELTGHKVHHNYGTDPRGAQGTVLRDMTFYSRGGTLAAADQNGIVIHTSCQLERTFAMNFGGHGIALTADVNNGTNASDCGIFWCGGMRNGLSGWYDQGGDVNACQILGFQSYFNGHWGIEARGFLGNFYLWFLTDGNGWGAGPSWAPVRTVSSVTYAGNHYRVWPNQDAGASANPPSGTTANNTWWYWEGAGVTNSVYPDYSPTAAYAAGGAFYASGLNARNVFAGYAEGDQNGGWSDSGTSVCMPGFASFSSRGSASLNVAGGAIVSPLIGSQNPAALAGQQIKALLGHGNLSAGYSNTFFLLGNSPVGATPWEWRIDENQVISNVFLGAGGSNVFTMRPFNDAARVGVEAPLGIKIGTVKHYGAAAVPAAFAWTLGDIVFNSTIGATGGDALGWRCIVAGTPGTWETLFATSNRGGIFTNGNVDKALTPSVDRATQYWNTPLTVDRTATLNPGTVQGQKFRVVRGAGATGAPGLDVGPGLKTLAAAGSWADVEYSGSAWLLTASGSL